MIDVAGGVDRTGHYLLLEWTNVIIQNNLAAVVL